MSMNEVSYDCLIKTEIDIPSVMVVDASANSEVNPKEIPGQARTRKELSLKEKLEILKLYDQLPKMSQRSAANQLKISQPVLCKILKNRNFIENIILTNVNSVRKRTRGGKEREVESALKLWYVDVQKKNIPINGQIIREKAKELAKQMGKEFAATDGWFTRWRKRENIVYNSLFRRKFKVEKEFECFQHEPKDHKPWVNVPERCTVYSDIQDDKVTEASEKYNSDSLDCQKPVKICSEHKIPDIDESKNWEMSKSICQVFIKSEPLYDEEFELEEKPSVNPPTDEEMLEALKILNAGVKHRTNDLQCHYEYEHYIYKLLKRVL